MATEDKMGQQGGAHIVGLATALSTSLFQFVLLLSALMGRLIGPSAETTLCRRWQVKVRSCSIGAVIAYGENNYTHGRFQGFRTRCGSLFYALEGHRSPMRNARRLDPLPVRHQLL